MAQKVCLWMVMGLLCSLGAGCSKQSAPQEEASEESHLRKVFDLCREYSVVKKKPVFRLEEVKQWAINEKNATEDDFLSTRDSQAYEIAQGTGPGMFCVYEQTGKAGKRFISLMGKVEELPSAEVDERIQALSVHRALRQNK